MLYIFLSLLLLFIVVKYLYVFKKNDTSNTKNATTKENVNNTDKLGSKSLHRAAENNDPEIIKQLIQSKVDVNKKTTWDTQHCILL